MLINLMYYNNYFLDILHKTILLYVLIKFYSHLI